MFDDERINYESGRIYRRGILLAVLYTLLFTVSRLLLTRGFGGITHYLTEGAVVLSGVVILLVGWIRWGFSRDERSRFEEHRYYLTAGKVFLVLALAGYAVSIPFRARVTNDYPVNELIINLETLGCVYFFFSFKRREVSFNYTFIHERGWSYYRRVLLNIAKLAGILLIPYGVASLLDLWLYGSFTMYVALLLGYIYSAVGLGLDYFLLSLLEKLNYDECIKSFRTAGEFFKKHFPDYSYKYYFCESWLLYEGNRDFMNADSNILKFSSLFSHVYSVKIDEQAIERIFGKRKLFKKYYPEKTSLQKSAKAYMQKGGKLGVGIGYIDKSRL